MNRATLNIDHLERTAGNDRLRRALAARLDRAFKRAGCSSARAARWLGVREYDVQYWRRGISVVPLNVCMRLATVRHLDVHRICTGQTQVA
ncbi:XRE family transcriptional regulator [Paraburkholderia sp. WC7.3b]|uniref:XRE family transcriptional regulator n=1 Tax=Paraburkholderia podalyriae TaxID=1938811 RepID=A0ABR7Q1G2_9BURK|nr:XRE family transcriptional regulator [Paraburkholderia podalyriae]